MTLRLRGRPIVTSMQKRLVVAVVVNTKKSSGKLLDTYSNPNVAETSALFCMLLPALLFRYLIRHLQVAHFFPVSC